MILKQIENVKSEKLRIIFSKPHDTTTDDPAEGCIGDLLKCSSLNNKQTLRTNAIVSRLVCETDERLSSKP